MSQQKLLKYAQSVLKESTVNSLTLIVLVVGEKYQDFMQIKLLDTYNQIGGELQQIWLGNRKLYGVHSGGQRAHMVDWKS